MPAPSEQIVDLSPDANGDRIAVVEAGEVSYLPATRVDIGATHTGSSGSCRYIRQASNGDLYLTGPTLERTMFCSSDNGKSWSGRNYDLGMERWDLARMPRDSEMGWVAAFTILQDDTFLMNVMPSNHRRNTASYIARSTDCGATWSVEPMELPLGAHRSVAGGNSDMIELADGTLLLTMDLFFYEEMDDEHLLPVEHQGVFAHVLRSVDGGRTWPEKSILTLHGAEAHLLQLPSGKLLSAIRRQRNIRLPGDPEDVVKVMRANGYTPEYNGYEEPIEESTAFFKSVFVSESGDAGRTWVNERRVSGYEQCSGELTLLVDGRTLVLTYDCRYNDRFARAGVRARVSYDLGETWEPEEYILGEGENYPGGIAMADGTLITSCPYRNHGPIQALHWTPRPPRGSAAS